ncbi:MAG: hypothetical protein J6Q82_01625 [Clostridia bacterium]|nr:hypothetical protein [Clostridia bacterium]
MTRRFAGTFFAIFLAAVCFFLPISAEESLPEGFSELSEMAPADDRGLLEDGFFSGDLEMTGRAVEQMMSPTRLFSLVRTLTERSAIDAIGLLATLCGLLLVAAVLTALSRTFASSALSGAVRFGTTVAIFAAILSYQYRALIEVQACLARLSALMGAMIPIAGSVWAMGGNVGTASAGTGVLYAFLTLTEHGLAKSVIPVCSFGMASALCSAISPEPILRGISSAIKKIYTFSLGLVMTLLLFSLSTTTALSSAADGMAARTAKLVSATVIPTVGGSVGETLRTVAASVQYLKGVVGYGGILLVLLLTLPVVLSLIATRLVFLLAGGVAEMLGCDSEAKLLSELGGIFGCMLAVAAMSGVMFILALTIFVKSTVAIG